MIRNETECERASFAILGCGRAVATQKIRQILGDDQAEACDLSASSYIRLHSPLPPKLRVILSSIWEKLRKSLSISIDQQLSSRYDLTLRWNTNACVLNFKNDSPLIIWQALVPPSHCDLAFRGEFDCVGEEVDENLFDPEGIAQKAGRVLFDMACQAYFDVLVLGDRSNSVECAFDHFAQGKGNMLERHGPAFQSGVVEDVIDQAKKIFAARYYRSKMLKLYC